MNTINKNIFNFKEDEMMSRKFFIVFIGFVLAIGLVSAGCDKLANLFPSLKTGKSAPADVTVPAPEAKAEAVSKDVLAKVGNWILTQQEFNEKIDILKKAMPDFDDKKLENRRLVLDELVRQQLLVGEAEKKGLEKNKDVSMAVDEYRKTVLVQQLAKGIVDTMQVTDKDVEDFYNDPENKELFVNPAEWRVREIVVADEAKGNELIASLAQGADFAELAKANSISDSASKGGDLGFVQELEDPLVMNQVMILDVGKTSNVFKGSKGYYIVKLEEKKGGDVEKLADIKAKPEDYTQLKDYVLAMKKQQALTDYIENLKDKTVITINEDLLK